MLAIIGKENITISLEAILPEVSFKDSLNTKKDLSLILVKNYLNVIFLFKCYYVELDIM